MFVRRRPAFDVTSVAFVTVLAWAILTPAEGHAALVLNLNPNPVVAHPGDTVAFTGTIVNTTGIDLQGTDMFLNFGGYDPSIFTVIDQLLGIPDFSLPDGVQSGVV